jgi:hypothetical protein
VLTLLKKALAEPAWQRAARELKNAVELDPAWRWFARLAMMHALLGWTARLSAIQRGRRGTGGVPPASWRGIAEAKNRQHPAAS